MTNRTIKRGAQFCAAICISVAGFATAQPTGTIPLAVAKNGTGSGVVTSAPTGINCGSTCSGSFASGSEVVLTATPAFGSVLTNWSIAFRNDTVANDRAKSEVTPCGQSTTCRIRMDGDQIVTVTFTAQGPVAQDGVQVPTLGLLAQGLMIAAIAGVGLVLSRRR